jgi:hypothetical protein
VPGSWSSSTTAISSSGGAPSVAARRAAAGRLLADRHVERLGRARLLDLGETDVERGDVAGTRAASGRLRDPRRDLDAHLRETPAAHARHDVVERAPDVGVYHPLPVRGEERGVRDVVIGARHAEAALSADLDLLGERHAAVDGRRAALGVAGDLTGEDRVRGHEPRLREPAARGVEVGGRGRERRIRRPRARERRVEGQLVGGDGGGEPSKRRAEREAHDHPPHRAAECAASIMKRR